MEDRDFERDMVAALALQGMLASSNGAVVKQSDMHELVVKAYEYADLMRTQSRKEKA